MMTSNIGARTIATGLGFRMLLNDGNYMPMFGLGMYKASGGIGGEAENAVTFALSHGYQMVDTAEYHGTEADVGRGIKKSGVRREDIFVVNKLFQNGYNRCLEIVHESLKKMQLEYFDMYCIHTPSNGKIIETYRALMELKDKGLIKSIGVCNFGIHHLEGLKSAGLPTPTINQIELHPWQRKLDIVRYCNENGIAIMAYSPLVKGKKFEDETLLQIAKGYNKSPAQVLIRWCVQQGYITIPKSSSPERVIANTDVFDWSIKQQDILLMETFPDFICSWNPIISPWKG